MNFLILTVLVNLVVKVAAGPSPWLYEKIHLLSDNPREASSTDRVKKFQIPATNATHQNNTETLPNNTLDAQHKKQHDNQTDSAVAKLYSFLKFTSQTKDNTTAAGVDSDDSTAARNTSLLKTNPGVADTASPSGNNASLAGNATFAGKNVTRGSLPAANGSQSAESLSDLKLKQQNPPSVVATAPLISQTTSAVSYRPSIEQYVGNKGAAVTEPLSQLGTSAKAAFVQPPRSYVPNRPLGYGTSIPGTPNNYLSGRWSVPISGSRTYATAWSHSYIPNEKAVFRTPVAGLKSYVPNHAVLRSPIPGQPHYIPNQAVLRSPVPGPPRYTLNHAVLRPASYTPNQAVLRSPIPGRASYTPNQAVLRSPIPGQPRYMPNRLSVHGGILNHTPYLPYARRHSVPNTPYRGGHLRQNPPQLPYARRQNVPYSYPFASKNSRPSLPGQKRTYMYGNVGQRALPHVLPVYTRHQVPVPRFAYRG